MSAAAIGPKQATSDDGALAEEVLGCLDDGKPVRRELGEGGRLHIDRALPFLSVHIGDRRNDLAARDVAAANASYLIAPDVETALPIVEALAAYLTQRFGTFLLLDIGEFERDTLMAQDAPYLPPFEMTVSSSDEPATRSAAAAFVKAVESVEAKFRSPQIAEKAVTDDTHARLAALAGGIACLTVRFAPIYRRPESDDIYPDLRERVVANIFDAGLQAVAAFAEATGALKLTTHRALGRQAFVEAVSRADRRIDDVASSFDFLLAVTPINADAAWHAFADSHYEEDPQLLYRPLAVQVEAEKKKLFSISFEHFEDPVLSDLYREKQQELDLQLTMLSARETPRFMELGRSLYGPVEPELLAAATDILAETTGMRGRASGRQADCYVMERRARDMIAAYRAQEPDFDATIELRDDVPAGMMVSGHRLLISRSTSVPGNRVEALLSHEVGVHLLTYFNGSAQGLRLFRSGLAGYEGVQEGLAVFAEYLVGGMTVARLRLIAARVVASAAMLDGAPFRDTFLMLMEEHRLSPPHAFNLTLRVYRSGGLCKDAIYLRGLIEVLDHLKRGGALEPFWMGKIAARHFAVMQELSARGLVKSPGIVPAFLTHPEAEARLDKSRAGLTPVDMIAS